MKFDIPKSFTYPNNMVRKSLVFLVSAFFFFIFASPVYASTLYLSPGSANIPQGSVVSVAVGLNTQGESINGISAYLAYPADKLEVAWISYGGSFSIAAEGAYGGGGIRISRGSISGVVGNVNVATIGFRGKSQGPATVSFIGGSAAPRTSDSSDSLNLGGSTGGTFTVVAGVSGGQAAGATGSPKDQNTPKISNINVAAISTNSATVSWTTDEKTDSEIEYGLQSGKYFLSSRDQILTTSHIIKIEGPAMTPGALFHFRVKSKDTAGNTGVSADQTFQLKGYAVTIKILDNENRPVKNTQIFLYSDPLKAETSSNGEASFANVALGKHLVVIKVNNNLDKTGEIDVQDKSTPQVFTLHVSTKLSDTGYLYLVLAVIGLVGTLILGTVIFVILKRKQKLINNPKVPQQTQV